MGTVTDTLEKFKESLSDFAKKHKDRINKDPEFRMQFHAMCLAVGVDPLASSKGFWADILGFGDFYSVVAPSAALNNAFRCEPLYRSYLAWERGSF